MPEPPRIPLVAPVLRRRAGIEQRDAGCPEETADLGRRQVEAVRTARDERRQRVRRRVTGAPLDGPALGLPGGEPPVEDADVLGTVHAERPPDTRRVQPLGVVVDDDRGLVTDPGTSCRGGDAAPRRERARRPPPGPCHAYS